MAPDLDRRTYDLLRLVDQHGPIGSIHLFELMQLHGYDIKDRTIRLLLSELDSLELTEKVPGQGRRLTAKGRAELEKGDVNTRLEQLRARIATLSSHVSYDPIDDSGVLVASAAFLSEADAEAALELIDRLETLPLGPLPVALEPSEEHEPGDLRLVTASSITLDGVLLAHGVDASISNSGVLEYEPTEDESDDAPLTFGGRILRYTDVINGEGSSIDVVSLLIEAGRSDVRSVIETGGRGLLVGDSREFPITRFEEARDLAVATRRSLGGALEFRRPREQDHLPGGTATWAFGSITYVGPGELLLTALSEYGLAADWETLYGTVERATLEPVRAARPEPTLDD
ncbi:NrpR regulatory domain-containing protein [Natrononativus amylolyticus]|uniref:NrpR regulatory domain-containing protein n=1 Tax=Natrononativus amylolyticus TaxID=2963434 RepID=UPI0020CFE140|nr:NrpR regulatory domain-containing protein [Natrononativus amylolyticus]